MDRIPAACCGAIGDGEETFVEFLGLPSREEKDLLSCPGLIVNTSSGPVRNKLRESTVNLYRLSFPRRRELTLDELRKDSSAYLIPEQEDGPKDPSSGNLSDIPLLALGVTEITA